MLNLLRMDLRRTFTSRTYKVGLGIVTLLMFGVAYMLYIVLHPELLGDSVGVLTSDDSFVLSVLTGFYMLVGLGFFTTILAILTGNLTVADFQSGFIKNIFSYHTNRLNYLASRLISMLLVSLSYLLVMAVIIILANYLFKIGLVTNSLAELMRVGLIAWLGSAAFIACMLALSLLFRSAAMTTAAAVIFGFGLGNQIVQMILSMLNLSGEIAGRSFYYYTTFGNLNSTDALTFGGNLTFPLTVFLVWFCVWISLASWAAKTKDI